MIDLSDCSSGSLLLSRDGRKFKLVSIFEDCALVQYGPSSDEVSFFSLDGRAEIDDPTFISDADIVSCFSQTTLF